MSTNSLFSHVSNVFEREGKQYFFNSKTQTSFSEASSSCQDNGLELVTVSSEEEFDFIVNFEVNNNIPDVQYWIGLKHREEDRPDRSTSTDFVFLSGNDSTIFFEEASVPPWRELRPNNLDGEDQNCVEWNFNVFPTGWDDTNCGEERFFICEGLEEKSPEVGLDIFIFIFYSGIFFIGLLILSVVLYVMTILKLKHYNQLGVFAFD